MPDLTIQFDNEKARKHFAGWLCGSGEDDYWTWMEAREYEDKDEGLTAIRFDFHGDDRKFFSDGIIRTTCGRITGSNST